MKRKRVVRLASVLFALHAAVHVNRPVGLPVGVLLQAGKSATVIPPDQESSGPQAQAGALLFYGSRVITGGDPLSFFYYPEKALYSFTPQYAALPLRNLDPTKANTDYEVRFDAAKGVIRQNMDPAISKALPGPLLLPNPQSIGRRDLSPDNANLLLTQIEAALRSATQPLDAALLRLSRATALEGAERLEDARQEYERVAATWTQAAWIRDKKIPAIDRQIRTDLVKARLARAPGRTLALLIGISDYKYTAAGMAANRITQAEFAERDVDLLRNHFQSPAGGGLRGDAIVSLTGPRATVFNIRNTLRDLLENKAGPNDDVIVFLSGQGWTDTIGEAKGFLMAYDSNPQDKETTAYPLEEMGSLIRGNVSRVKRIYLLADLCRMPTVASAPNTVNSILSKQFDAMPGQAEIVLSSSVDVKPVQVSHVDPGLEGGHGIFSYYLFKGLQGAADANHDRKITPDELFNYVSERVAAATKDKQQPVRIGHISDMQLSLVAASGAPPLRLRPNRLLLAFAGDLRSALFALAQGPAAQTPSAAPQSAPSTDPTALEDEGQQIILQYLNGEETPPTLQDFERGEDRFRRAYALDESSRVLARLLFFVGRSKISRRDASGVADLRNAVDLDPAGAYAFNALGIGLLQTAAFPEAAGAFRDAIDRAPHWVYPHHNLGLTYSEAGVYDAAEREYREAIRMEPGYSYVHYSLAALLHKLGRKNEAEREYRSSIRLNPLHPEPYIGLGAVLASLGKRSEAETTYKTAIHLNPNLPAAAHDLGLLYAKEKKPNKAIETWKGNLEVNPKFVPSRMSLAKAYVDKRQFDDAITQYQAVLDQSNDYAAAKMALYETQGDRYRSMKQVDNAREQYKRALALAVDERDKKRLNRKMR